MDNGGEFTSGNFEKYLKERGVEHQVTALYTSAQTALRKGVIGL
jgi:hypothetical protein